MTSFSHKTNTETVKGKKVIRKINRILDRILIIPFLLLFLLGMYALLDTVHVYYHAQDKSILKYKPDLLHPENNTGTLSGSTAWLTIDDTNIDYPVMQGKDNFEYLNKDPFGDFSLSGSLFLDYRNAPDYTDSYSLIYGHHMEYSTMFGALDEFQDKDYLKEHESGTLIVGKTVYKIHLFACINADAKDNVIFNPDDTSSELVIERIQSSGKDAVNDSVDTEGKRILALSTCKGTVSDNRTVVFGTLEKE